jgi:hypothetical protein
MSLATPLGTFVAGCLAVLLAACGSSPPPAPSSVVTAAFDPVAGVLPAPDALAIDSAWSPHILAPRNADDELRGQLAALGGYPTDLVVPLRIPLATLTTSGPVVSSNAPDLDVGSVVPCTDPWTPSGCNLLVFELPSSGQFAFPAMQVTYEKGTTSGTLLVTPVIPEGLVSWKAGATYVYALRGGDRGPRTLGGAPIQPSPTTYLLLFGRSADFTCPASQPDCPLPRLRSLQERYRPLLGLVQAAAFPLEEIAVAGSFQVADMTTWVIADPVRGFVPIPSDFLLDPATNRVSSAAASRMGAPELATLDGFSTSALEIAPTSTPIRASSVRSSAGKAVHLYRLASGGGSATEISSVLAQPPVLTLDPATEKPCLPVNAAGDFAETCRSSNVGLQPAVTVSTPSGPLALPPLEERTEYAIVITRGVTDTEGEPISRSTLGRVLLLQHPICIPSPACAGDPAGATSQLPAISAAQASRLEAMRLRLLPVASALAEDHGLVRSDIAMAYTFRTQSITAEALRLGALPYAKVASTGADRFPDAPTEVHRVTPEQLATEFEKLFEDVPDPVNLVLTPGVRYLEGTMVGFNRLDPATGAFYADLEAGRAEDIPVLLALPDRAPPPGGWPLVIYHHGLGLAGKRGDALKVARALADAGMAVAAIDAIRLGLGDLCVSTSYLFQALDGGPRWGVPPPALSFEIPLGKCLLQARDTFRQDILDESMLVRVLTSPSGSGMVRVAAGLPDGSVPFDTTRVYYVGQSIGSIEGASDVAANPRISRAVLATGGGPLLDVIENSANALIRAFYPQLLEALGAKPWSPAYLRFLITFKWALDPADPVNFARHLVSTPLPDLLADPSGATPQAPKAVLGMGARCDDTVPNGQTSLLYALVGLAPFDPVAESAHPGVQWYMTDTGGTCPPGGDVGPGVAHAFLIDWTQEALVRRAQENMVGHLLGSPAGPTPVLVP